MGKDSNRIKNKAVAFTVSEDTHQIWRSISEELIRKRVFRNKTEIFEKLVLFLQSSVLEKIESFRDSAQSESLQVSQKNKKAWS